VERIVTVIHLVKPIDFIKAMCVIEWLKANAEHKFTGEGISEITFRHAEDAVLFKLLFDV